MYFSTSLLCLMFEGQKLAVPVDRVEPGPRGLRTKPSALGDLCSRMQETCDPLLTGLHGLLQPVLPWSAGKTSIENRTVRLAETIGPVCPGEDPTTQFASGIYGRVR